jgi:hypothetical protein
MKRTMRIFLALTTAMTLLSYSNSSLFPEAPSALFDSDEILELTLTTDLKTVQKDIKEVHSYHPAQISYINYQNRKVSFNVEVKSRGHFRRNPKICDSPPLQIKFNPAKTRNSIFREQTSLKMVTHCKKRIKAFDDYVIQEYLIYKLYNILTERSFRTRLAYVTYVDSKERIKPYTRYGFFIENTVKMAKRLNGESIENIGAFNILAKIKKKDQAFQAVFQFMISNPDWSIPKEQNINLIKLKDGWVFPVPYDFDMAGMIDVHYAYPHPRLRIKSFRERSFHGYPGTDDQLPAVFSLFNQKKEQIYTLYNNFPYLKQRYKKRSLRYLDSFYKIINNPLLVEKHFILKGAEPHKRIQ